MQFPITIGLRRSRFLDAFIFLSALLAGAGALALPILPLIKAAILCINGLFAVLAWQHLKPRISAIRLEQNGEVSLLHVAEKEFVAAELLPGATVHPWLTVLRLKSDAKPHQTQIVTVDSLNGPDFRRLRVFLRWRADFNGLNDDV